MCKGVREAGLSVVGSERIKAMAREGEKLA
jgi:hypothetical protein